MHWPDICKHFLVKEEFLFITAVHWGVKWHGRYVFYQFVVWLWVWLQFIPRIGGRAAPPACSWPTCCEVPEWPSKHGPAVSSAERLWKKTWDFEEPHKICDLYNPTAVYCRALVKEAVSSYYFFFKYIYIHSLLHAPCIWNQEKWQVIRFHLCKNI